MSAAEPPRWGADRGTAVAVVVMVVLGWAVAKAVSIWGWVVLPAEYSDTFYYFQWAERAHQGGGVAAALREYPTPAAWVLLGLYEAGARDFDRYRGAILWVMTLADAAFAVLLGRRLGPSAVVAWTLLVTAMGQLALLRFDLLPAVAAGAAVLLATFGRGVAASVLVAVGTGLKLWPVVLAPLPLAAASGRLRAAVAFVGTGVVLVVGSLLTGGWSRLLSPWGYQGGRGLQIEAVAASVPMWLWRGDQAYDVWYSTFHAFEVRGPSVELWLRVAGAASLLALVACAALVVGWWVRGAAPAALGYVALTCIGAFVVTSRALSPQYLLWLAAPAAVVLGLGFTRQRGARLGLAVVTFALLVLLCLLTTSLYPTYYPSLTGRSALTDRSVALLVARNVGLVAFVAWTAACALGETSAARRRNHQGAALSG